MQVGSPRRPKPLHHCDAIYYNSDKLSFNRGFLHYSYSGTPCTCYSFPQGFDPYTLMTYMLCSFLLYTMIHIEWNVYSALTRQKWRGSQRGESWAVHIKLTQVRARRKSPVPPPDLFMTACAYGKSTENGSFFSYKVRRIFRTNHAKRVDICSQFRTIPT